MTRTAARELAVRLCFAEDFRGDIDGVLSAFFDEEHYAALSGEDPLFTEFPDEAQLLYIRSLVEGACSLKPELDGYIRKYAEGWKPERISRTAATILRCAMYEILYMDDVPDAAAINEAVELAKRYDEPETVGFINGVLGGFVRGEKSAE